MAKSVAFLAILGFAFLFETACSATCPSESENDEATYLPHETECGKFYECQNGKPKVFDCPRGTYFDSTLDVCSWDVNCGNLETSTVPPPTTPTTPTPPTDAPTDAPATTEPPLTTSAE